MDSFETLRAKKWIISPSNITDGNFRSRNIHAPGGSHVLLDDSRSWHRVCGKSQRTQWRWRGRGTGCVIISHHIKPTLSLLTRPRQWMVCSSFCLRCELHISPLPPLQEPILLTNIHPLRLLIPGPTPHPTPRPRRALNLHLDVLRHHAIAPGGQCCRQRVPRLRNLYPCRSCRGRAPRAAVAREGK